MKSAILILCTFLCGCAAFRGQFKFTGTSDVPIIKEYKSTMQPWGRKFSYTAPVDKIVEVYNGSSEQLTAIVYCEYVLFQIGEVIVPPHMYQQLVVTTNRLYADDTLCRIIYYAYSSREKK